MHSSSHACLPAFIPRCSVSIKLQDQGRGLQPSLSPDPAQHPRLLGEADKQISSSGG